MASFQHLNSSHPTRTHTRPPFASKAQTCFFNILHIISSIPPSSQNPKPQSAGNKGIGIDLNLQLCTLPDTAESESFGENGTHSSTNKASEEEEEEKNEVVREKSVGISEATVSDTQDQSFKVDTNEVEHVEAKSEGDSKGNEEFDGDGEGDVVETVKTLEGNGSANNCLDLLIEAAKLVFANEDEFNSEETSGNKVLSREFITRRASRGTGALDETIIKKRKKRSRWVVVDLCGEMDNTSSPVVRSKRGRSQALPYRFRDSVVEPLKRSGRLHRPSSTAVHRKRLVGS